MIIHALADAAAHLHTPPAGYQDKATPWALTLTLDGRFVSLAPLTETGPNGKTRPLHQPVPKVTRTHNVAPQLVCDTGVYALGMAKPPGKASDSYDPWDPTPRDTECHEAWTQIIRDWNTTTPTLGAAAILAWVDAGHPGRKDTVGPLTDKDQRALAKANVVIHLDGVETPVHRTPEAIGYWIRHLAADKVSGRGLCAECGTPGQLVSTIPNNLPVGLVPGTDQTPGVALTSANFATASRNLKVSQLKNAPVCLDCALGSVAALTALAADPHHRWRGDDAWTVWWLRSGQRPEIMDWLDQPPSPADVAQIYDQLRAGQPTPQVGDPDDLYYSLTYSGRQARMRFVKWFGPTDPHEFWPRLRGGGCRGTGSAAAMCAACWWAVSRW